VARNKRRSRPAFRLIRIVLAVVLAAALGWSWTLRGPTVTRPGRVIDLTRRLGVPDVRGRMLLTTVEHGPVPMWRLLLSKVSRSGRSLFEADGTFNTSTQMFNAKKNAWLDALDLLEGAGIARETMADQLRTMPPVNTDRVTGPSGGLMLALAFAQLLGGGDLTAGRVVAGTGTIDRNGTVGEIGYAGYKVQGAVAARATIFFVPSGNQVDAVKAAPPGVQVVAVNSFFEALGWLCHHGGKSFACTKLIR
jgi:PDZ domain-containing secreted protein